MDDVFEFLYWGKASAKAETGPRFHLLPLHCLDVAAVAAAWWDSSRSLRRQFVELTQFSMEESQLQAWVLFFVALHDLGKFDIRFQSKAIEILLALQVQWKKEDLPDAGEATRYAHGEYGVRWFVREYQMLLGVHEKNEQILDIWLPWLAAVAGHHGRVPRHRQPAIIPDAEPWIIQSDCEARCHWFRVLEDMFLRPSGLSLSDGPPPISQDDSSYLAGFCAVCDWLGSNETWFPYQSSSSFSFMQYFEGQVSMVERERLLERCGLLAHSATYEGVQALLAADESPRQLQTLVDALPAKAGLTLIEAPTGAGKTETALAYAWRLLEAGVSDSIVFALPTQATANAMWDRLNRFADILFGNGSNLVLAHGKARWHEGHGLLREAGRKRSAQADEDVRVQCAEWLAESRKRVFLGQIGVCTIDQVLLSVLPLRHKFVRGFGVMKSVLIVDEVHAYDYYMYGLLDGVLRQQRRAGGSAILLSATLPHGQRRRLAETWGTTEAPAAHAAYPLLTRIDETGHVSLTVLEDQSQRPPSRTVAVESLPLTGLFPDDALISRVIAAAEEGARVAIVCNLVNDAQRLACSLRAATDVGVDLFHARFRFIDRQEREQEVLARYGRDATRNKGRILVATQVVEQSLDLDFDWLITQLCPVDLLFQRMGRLHRHIRPHRPQAFKNPQCTVLVAPEADYGSHKVVYGNTRVLWRTQQLLESANEIVFPEAYRTWIERVYERDDWSEEPEKIALEFEKFNAEENAKFSRAKILANDDMNPLADSDENVRALTRDGEMSLSLVLIDTEGRLLGDSELFAEVDEWTQRERLALNAVGVPVSWKEMLPVQDENGMVWLIMHCDETGNWTGQGRNASFRYSSEYGLEKEEA